jgi:hypothetical protein
MSNTRAGPAFFQKKEKINHGLINWAWRARGPWLNEDRFGLKPGP